MTIAAALLACLLAAAPASRPASRPITNDFFAMDTATKDAAHQTIPEQVRMVKELGYAGWGPTGTGDVPEMLKAVDAAGLKMYALYVGINIDPDQPKYDPKLKDTIRLLKGRKTVLWIFVLSAKHKPSSTDGDARAVEILGELADLCEQAGITISLYPHVKFYMERVEDAVRLADKLDRKSVGVTFNLCHWLSLDHGKNMQPLLELARPRLNMVTINGADFEGGWDKLIRPLGEGEFDVCGFVKALRKLGYAGPIGFQGYGIKGDLHAVLKKTMDTWRAYDRDCR